MLKDLAAVAVGGALGATSRHLLSIGAAMALGDRFPYGTLAVNVLGSFLLAGLLTTAAQTLSVPRWLILTAGTGFMGAFTTFSTFSWQTLRLAEQAGLWMAALNVALNVGLCLAAAGLGVVAARALAG